MPMLEVKNKSEAYQSITQWRRLIIPEERLQSQPLTLGYPFTLHEVNQFAAITDQFSGRIPPGEKLD